MRNFQQSKMLKQCTSSEDRLLKTNENVRVEKKREKNYSSEKRTDFSFIENEERKTSFNCNFEQTEPKILEVMTFELRSFFFVMKLHWKRKK